MKILVTGGSGFLGINLIRSLLEKGVEDIVSLDLVPFDYPEKDRIAAISGDIRNPQAVARAVSGCDMVVHAAAALPLEADALLARLRARLGAEAAVQRRRIPSRLPAAQT